MNVSVRGDIPPTIISKGLHLFDDVLKPVFIEKNKTYHIDEKKTCLLNHFNLCIKSGDDTTNIETLYFQTVFDICISDKFLDKAICTTI
jgi:hypothetical protein